MLFSSLFCSSSARLLKEYEEAREAAEVAARKDLVTQILRRTQYNLLKPFVDVLSDKISKLGVAQIQQKIANRDTADLRELCGGDVDTYGQFSQGTNYLLFNS